jgi:zinc protease
MIAAMKRMAAVVALVAWSSCTPKDPTYSFKYAEKRARLDNGLRLVVIPDRTTPLVQVDVRYEVGSNEDPPGKAGLAHMAEHMMFQHRMLGPDKPATFDLLPQIALSYNGRTDYDRTHYYLIAGKEDLESLLRVEAFRMNARCRTIPPAEFDREREVVRNEIRRIIARPAGLAGQIIARDVYPPGHPYSHDAGGDDRQLAAIRFEDVCDFVEKYYTPDRATVIVSGNVDPDDVGRRVVHLFGGIPRRTAAPRAPVPAIALKAKRVEHEMGIERPSVVVLWRLPPDNSPDSTKAAALFAFTGRLARLAEEWDFASNVSVARLGGALAPVFALIVELPPGGDVDRALGYIWRVTSKAHWGLGSLDFDREAKNRLKMDFVAEIEGMAGRAARVADAIQFPTGEVDFGAMGQEYLLAEFKRIDSLTADGYGDFVKNTLDRDKAVVVVFRPAARGGGDIRAALDYSPGGHDEPVEPLVDPAEARRPLPAPRGRLILDSAERYTLSNGMRVILLAYDGLPLVRAHLLFDAGAAVEPQAGLAAVAAEFIQPPAGANFGYWVSFGGGSGRDVTEFASSGLNIYTDVVIEALERTVATGEYDQEAIERLRKRIRRDYQGITARRNLAFRHAMNAALYGEDHPYTTNGIPTPQSIANIGRDAAMSFKRDNYNAANATLVVVGNFDKARAREKIQDTFGGWKAGRKSGAPPAAAKRSGPVHAGVIGAEEQQMEVTIAYPAPPGRDGQHAARLVMTEMLNDAMGAVRNELGASYGVYAARTDDVGPNAYQMSGRVDSARAGEALTVMRAQLDALRRGDDFDRRMALARREVLRRLVTESTETRAMVERLARIAAFGLGPDAYDTLIRLVAAVSPAQVKALIAEELAPEKEVVVGMADRATLEKAFRGAGLSGVRYIEP